MRAVLFSGERQVEVRDLPVPEPGSGEVLVRTKASAIYRSDLRLYYGQPVVGGDAPAPGRSFRAASPPVSSKPSASVSLLS